MKDPIHYRKNIPFFYDKSEEEFRKDNYEHYDSMVIRQAALHLADDLWDGYPMQPIVDFGLLHWPYHEVKHILELGCGVGRWIGEIAMKYPNADCWGMDYSYQLLKMADEAWIREEDVQLNLSKYGFSHMHTIKGKSLKNIQFGLSKAESLPFADKSQDLVLSSFLFDRLEDPLKGLQEMHRVLRPNGRIIMITPLNFLKSNHWDKFYPPIKIYHLLMNMGLEILDWVEDLKIVEPLDVRGNSITWKSLGVVCKKVEGL